MDGNGKAEAHVHTARVSLDRRVDELVELGVGSECDGDGDDALITVQGIGALPEGPCAGVDIVGSSNNYVGAPVPGAGASRMRSTTAGEL